MIGVAFKTLLNNAGAVTAIVGSNIYPLNLPQHPALPAITYRFQTDRPEITFDGQGDFQEMQAEFDCWANDYDAMVSLSTAVQAALKNYSGTVAGVEFQKIYIESTVSVFENEAEYYRDTVQVTVYLR